MKIPIFILLAALAMFLWGMVSWTVSPLHKNYASFKDEAAVAAVLKQNAPSPAVYRLPGANAADGTMVEQEEWIKRYETGPFLQGFVRPGASDTSMAISMLGGYAVYVIASVLLFCLLCFARPESRGRAVIIGVISGVLIWTLEWLPAVNWWGWPLGYTLPYLLDAVIYCGAGAAILYCIPALRSTRSA